ncbi:MAG: hypothetical protein U1F50_08195 [Rubrivivax sp.]
MPGLLTQIEQAVGGLDLGQLAGGAGDQYGALGSAIGSWSGGPPGGFGQALSGLGSVQVPGFSIAGGLGQGLGAILPSLQGDVGGLVGQLSGNLGALPGKLQGDLVQAVKPLLDRIETLRTLLASDLSCGLVPGFAPPTAAPAPAPGAPPPAPAPGPSPAPSPAPAAQGAVTPAQVDAAKALVDTLPADLSIPGLMHWLHDRLGTVRPGYFTVRSLPLFDDLRDPLDTLVRWEGASASAVQAELAQTLATLTSIVQAQTSGRFTAALPPATVNALPAAALGTAAETYVAALEALATAVQAANVAALPAAFTAAQNARAALLVQNTAVANAQAARDALASGLAALPDELDAGLCRLLLLLQPRATLADVADRLGPLAAPELPPEALQPVTDLVDGVHDRLQAVLDAIDVGAVTQPLTDALTAADDAVKAVEQGLAQLSAQVVQAIGQARQAVQGLDLDSVRQQAQQAIEGVTKQVTDAIANALGPATQAMGEAMTEVFEAMDDIDPEALAKPIRDAIQALGNVIQQEAVQRLTGVLGQLQQLAQEIATLSFEPVADEVIDLIGKLQDIIAGIDIASLPDPGPALISGAMQVLPPSLVPVTDPLVAELGQQIDGSPIELLERVKTLPDQVRGKLLEFSPRRALDPVLSKPFQDAVSRLDQFAPTQWLAAGDSALAGVRRQLAAQMDVGKLLAEPGKAFDAVNAELDKLKPSTLLAPLTQAVQEAVSKVANLLPVGDLAAGLDGVLGRVTSFTATVHSALDVAAHVLEKVAGLADPEAGFEDWVDGILVKVPANASGPLATAIGDLRSAALVARPAPLADAWSASRAALALALQQADATARLTRHTLARSRVSAGLSNPAVGAAVPGLAAWLNDAQTRSAADGLAALAALDRALAAADSALAQQFESLAARFPAEDGPLAPLLPEAGDTALREWVREALLRQLGVPLVALLGALKPVGALLATAVDALRTLADAIDARLADLLAAPQALAGLLGDVAAVQQRIAGLDLGVYTREVDTVYAALRDELAALDPRSLQKPLEDARDRLLATLSLQTILPPALRGQLDSAYKQLVAKLGSLDPDKLLLEPLDDEYRQTVEPLVQALDISATVQLIIDWLHGLPDDLKAQIARIDGPYGELLHSAPGGGGGSAGVSL